VRFLMSKLVGAAAAVALCATPTMAAAAPTAIQPVNPLIAVSLYGTQAAAQAVCSAAQAAQGATGCVLPATEAPPPIGQPAVPPPPPLGGNFGINWLLLGLGSLALLAGLYTLFDDDDDDGAVAPISPN
jgi:hypothetical protein